MGLENTVRCQVSLLLSFMQGIWPTIIAPALVSRNPGPLLTVTIKQYALNSLPHLLTCPIETHILKQNHSCFTFLFQWFIFHFYVAHDLCIFFQTPRYSTQLILTLYKSCIETPSFIKLFLLLSFRNCFDIFWEISYLFHSCQEIF